MMSWTFGKSFKYTSKVIVAPATTNILSAFASISEDGEIITTVMAFDPNSQTSVYVCASSFLEPKCNMFANPNDYVLYSNDGGSQNQLALFSEGGVYGYVWAK